MAYSASYDAADLGTIIVDFMGNVFAELAAQGGTIGTIVVLGLVLGLLLLALDRMFGLLGGMTRKWF